jgi:hypothetical protein
MLITFFRIIKILCAFARVRLLDKPIAQAEEESGAAVWISAHYSTANKKITRDYQSRASFSSFSSVIDFNSIFVN